MPKIDMFFDGAGSNLKVLGSVSSINSRWTYLNSSLMDFRRCGDFNADQWQSWVKSCIPHGVTLKDGLIKGNLECYLDKQKDAIVLRNLSIKDPNNQEAKIVIPILKIAKLMQSTSVITGVGFADKFTQYSSGTEDCWNSLNPNNEKPSMKVTIGKDGNVGVWLNKQNARIILERDLS
jgi:hypothetical protein